MFTRAAVLLAAGLASCAVAVPIVSLNESVRTDFRTQEQVRRHVTHRGHPVHHTKPAWRYGVEMVLLYLRWEF